MSNGRSATGAGRVKHHAVADARATGQQGKPETEDKPKTSQSQEMAQQTRRTHDHETTFTSPRGVEHHAIADARAAAQCRVHQHAA